MARAAITMGDVSHVAQALRERGEGVSTATVRTELDWGLFNPIKSLLGDWLVEHPEQTAPQPALLATLPDRLVMELETATRGLWAAATAVAESRLQTEFKGCQQQVAAAEADRDDAATVADALATTSETLTGQVAALQAQLAELQRRGHDADHEQATLVAQLAQERAARQMAAARDAVQERHNADLKGELEKRVILASERERAEGAAAEVQVIRKEAETAVAGLRGQPDQVRGEAAQAQGAPTTTQAHLETQTRLLEQKPTPAMVPVPEIRRVKAAHPIRAHPPQAAGKPWVSVSGGLAAPEVWTRRSDC